MERIQFKEALQIIDRCRYQKTDEVFSITFLKCDRTRKQGGDWRTIERAQVSGLPYSVRDNEMRGVIDLDSGMKSAFHIQLVFEINGKRVYK